MTGPAFDTSVRPALDPSRSRPLLAELGLTSPLTTSIPRQIAVGLGLEPWQADQVIECRRALSFEQLVALFQMPSLDEDDRPRADRRYLMCRSMVLLPQQEYRSLTTLIRNGSSEGLVKITGVGKGTTHARSVLFKCLYDKFKNQGRDSQDCEAVRRAADKAAKKLGLTGCADMRPVLQRESHLTFQQVLRWGSLEVSKGLKPTNLFYLSAMLPDDQRDALRLVARTFRSGPERAVPSTQRRHKKFKTRRVSNGKRMRGNRVSSSPDRPV